MPRKFHPFYSTLYHSEHNSTLQIQGYSLSLVSVARPAFPWAASPLYHVRFPSIHLTPLFGCHKGKKRVQSSVIRLPKGEALFTIPLFHYSTIPLLFPLLPPTTRASWDKKEAGPFTYLTSSIHIPPPPSPPHPYFIYSLTTPHVCFLNTRSSSHRNILYSTRITRPVIHSSLIVDNFCTLQSSSSSAIPFYLSVFIASPPPLPTSIPSHIPYPNFASPPPPPPSPTKLPENHQQWRHSRCTAATTGRRR